MESRKTNCARALGFVLLALFVFPQVVTTSLWGSEFQGKGPLFVVEDHAGKGIESLKELPVELYLRDHPHYLLSVPSSLKGEIMEKGFSLREIGWVEAGKSLFLLNRHAGSALAGPPSRGNVLHRGDGWFLVEGDDDLIRTFGEEEFQVTVIPGRPLPVEISRSAGVIIPGQKYGEASLSPDIREKMASSDTTIGRYIQRLQDFQTRYSYTDSVVAAAEWIHDKFLEFGFTDVAYDSFQFNSTWQRNVVATKAGTTNPDKVIVIGGHYDSVTYSGNCDPMTWAPGADDNASGTSVAMDMARLLVGTDTEMTLKFVPFAAEEQGLHGSWHFAEEAYNSGMDIELMINMDMIGWVPDPYLNIGINTDTQSRSYAEMMAQVAEDSTILIPEIRNSGGGSDHYPFQQYGFNHVYVEEGDFNFTHWHQCSDSLGNLDLSYMAQVENMIIPTILLVANAPVTPTGLQATDHGDGDRIRLDWDANSEPDLWGYRVFSGPAPDSFDQVDTAFVNTFTLEGLTAGESLYVAVSAVDTDGYQSPASDPVGTIPLTRPRPPTGLDATSTADDISLSWAENEELDLAGYILYRAERGVGTYAPIDTVPNSQTSFVDQDVQAQVYYLYQVTAYDAVGMEGDPSDVLRGRLVTHDAGILVIDASKDGTGGPFSPSDEQVDTFYENALAGFNLAAQWDHADSMAVGRRPVDADLAIYSTVVLHLADRYGEDLAPDTLHLSKYLDNGGSLMLDGWLMLARAAAAVPVLAVSEFPLGMKGAARFNIANALGAICIADALDLPVEAMRAGLSGFTGSADENPGRGNFIELGGVTAVVDFAHNPHGVAAFLGALATLPAKRRAVLIGQAGDRSDADTAEMTRVIWEQARPDLVVVKELPQKLRGRRPGELPAVIEAELRRLGAGGEVITHAGDELEATRRALEWAQAGDMLVLLIHEDRRPVMALLDSLRERGWRPGQPLDGAS